MYYFKMPPVLTSDALSVLFLNDFWQLIINQTDRTAYEEFSFSDKNGVVHNARMLSIQQKGLSQSRNLAIDYAQCDILLIADDDENFVNSYPSLILNSLEFITHFDHASQTFWQSIIKLFDSLPPITFLFTLTSWSTFSHHQLSL